MLPWSLLHILIEISFPADGGKIAEFWKIAVLPQYPPPLYSLEYGTWGICQANGKTTTHPKMGPLKQTMWQLWAAEVRQWCSKIAACSDRA
jgi:hypothetical protein